VAVKPSGQQAIVLVVAVLATATVSLARESLAAAQAVVSDPGCTANVIPRNDDDDTAPIPLGFDVFIGDQFRSSLRVSNNGYVAFSLPTPPLWWILRAWELFNIPLIALFHADVDTRGPAASPVTYGPISFGGHPALCVNWVDVGHFDTQDSLLNRFQLILVSRSDTGAGDVDVYMNYDQIQWDDPTGTGVVLPRAGIYDGTTVLHELPGSNAVTTMIDGGPDALIGKSLGSAVLGRYVFPLRGGLPPDTAVVTGVVLDTNNALIAGAVVQACDTCAGIDACVLGSTDSAGRYNLSGFAPADLAGCPVWKVTVSPPAGSQVLTNHRDVTFTATDQVIADADVVLAFPTFIPSGTSIVPSVGGGFGSVPRVYWQAPLTLTTKGCPSVAGLNAPVARYMITQSGPANFARCDAPDEGLLQCGDMIETPPPRHSGTYVAAVPALAPAHGAVTVTMSLTCPDPDPTDEVPPLSGTSAFDLYIDPSGWVQTVEGAPLAGATVTLYRSESPVGPFAIVPGGSALMSPKNRSNPDQTDAEGHFAWDTVAGYYVVRAEYPGCFSPTEPSRTYVETEILAVPPEWVDLHLYLDCGGIAPPQLSLPTQVLADASSTAGAVVSYAVSANDDRDGPVSVTCAPTSGGLFGVGLTTVACSATDAANNVAHGSFPVLVSYAWTNVLAPLHPGGGNRLKRGRTVPVKFALRGASLGITNLVAKLYVAAVIGGVPGPEVPARSSGGGHDSQFHYQPCDRDYEFEWSTRGLEAGHYQLRIDLGDGVARTVPVELR